MAAQEVNVNIAAWHWHMPVQVTVALGCSERLGAELGSRQAIVLAFESSRSLGLKIKMSAGLGNQLLAWIDCPDQLSSLGLAQTLSEQVWPLAERYPHHVLIGLGGGTTMDLAKLLRCRPAEGDFSAIAQAVRGQAAWPDLVLSPLWLIPTTAGTGSEVTRWATIWDTDINPPVKRSFDELFGYAQRALIDPALSLSCPAQVTRDCGLDALSHALEALWNHHANPISSALALSAARCILATLPALLREPGSLYLRESMSVAALQAGVAFSQTRTALAHALSYQVTLEHNVPHGLACALWLPSAWQMAVGCSTQTDALLSEVFDCPASDGAQHLEKWLHGLGVETRPQAYEIADAQRRIDDALNSPRGRNFIGSTQL